MQSRIALVLPSQRLAELAGLKQVRHYYFQHCQDGALSMLSVFAIIVFTILH